MVSDRESTQSLRPLRQQTVGELALDLDLLKEASGDRPFQPDDVGHVRAMSWVSERRAYRVLAVAQFGVLAALGC